MANTILVIAGIIVFIVLISIKQINQYQKGIKFLLGKYTSTREWPSL